MDFKRVAVPEDAGVNSAPILDFFEKCDAINAENHSMVVVKDGVIAFESYTAPYANDIPHFMFSVTKSFVGTAVGFAIDEGLLKLSDRFIDIFPEYAYGAELSPAFADITVEKLLMMKSLKKYPFVQIMAGKDYLEDFVNSDFRKGKALEKDEGFHYSNNDAHVLADMVEKVSGMSVVDFLMPRLFQPLGIARPQWEKTVKGRCAGGLGLYLKTEDLAKFGTTYLNGGVFDGKQVIPAWWVEEASKMHVDLHDNPHKGNGYGYLFWMHEYGYLAEGLMGQACVVYPAHNAVVAITSMTCRQHDMMEAFYECFPLAFELPSDGTKVDALQERLKKNSEYAVKKGSESPMQKIVDGKRYKIKKKFGMLERAGLPISMLPFTLTMVQPQKPAKSISEVGIKFFDGYAELSWREDTDFVTVKCGMDGKLLESEITLASNPYKMLCSCAWTADNTLEFNIFPINTLVKRFVKVVFAEDGRKLKIYPTATPGMDEFIVTHAARGGVKSDNPKIDAILQKLLKWIGSKTVPELKAKEAKQK